MFDFTGVQFHFSCTAGLAEVISLRFSMAGHGRAVELGGSTWRSSVIRVEDSSVVDGSGVYHGGGTGLLLFRTPKLDAGLYRYEVFATDASGCSVRVLYGLITAVSSDYADKLLSAAADANQRVLDVVVPAVNGEPLELRWAACTVASVKAQQAKEEADRSKTEADRAKVEADRAEGAAGGAAARLDALISRAEGAVGKVEDMEGRLGAIDNHIRDSVVPNATTNTWWVAGKDTHYPVTGDPGRSPKLDADGYWLVYDDGLHEYVSTRIKARGEDGRCPAIGSNGNWLLWNQDAQQWEDSHIPAHGRNGVDGASVRRVIVAAVADIPTEGGTCNGAFYYYVPKGDNSFDVYAWLERPDGAGGWVCVGEACDIATSEIYGLVKTGTDVVVRDGAPVGCNEQGRMCVPLAEQVSPGSVRISYPDTLTAGGRVGFDADKRLRGEAASVLNHGDVKLSYSGERMTDGNGEGTIGLRADGSIGVRWATRDAPGVVRLGSSHGQLNRIPYQQGVGATEDHQIVNNILFKGALQHQMLKGWMNKNMPWLASLDASLEGSRDRRYLNNDDYYTGLFTSPQFRQSEDEGLVLLSATGSLLGGVYLADGMDATGVNYVPSAKKVKDYVEGYVSSSLDAFYTRADIDDAFYTKEAVDDTFYTKGEADAFREQVNNYVEGVNGTFGSYLTKEAAARDYVSKSTGVEGWRVMTVAEFNALEAVNENYIYMLVGGAV